ncbi:unnamed protein product, partial [Meganyctiphanes norvegica]
MWNLGLLTVRGNLGLLTVPVAMKNNEPGSFDGSWELGSFDGSNSLKKKVEPGSFDGSRELGSFDSSSSLERKMLNLGLLTVQGNLGLLTVPGNLGLLDGSCSFENKKKFEPGSFDGSRELGSFDGSSSLGKMLNLGRLTV